MVMSEKGSMLNTPPTYAIYMAGLCLEWLRDQGGVPAIYERNRRKAAMLYDYLDRSELFHGRAEKDSYGEGDLIFHRDSILGGAGAFAGAPTS